MTQISSPAAKKKLERGLQVHKSGDLASALRDYEEILQSEPDHAEALHLSGLVLHQQGEHRAAIQRIETALQKRPRTPLFMKNLASAYRSAGDLDHAESMCENCLSSEPEDLTMLMLSAKIHEDKGEQQEAIDRYQKVLKHSRDPELCLDAHIKLGDCCSRLGDHAAAITVLRQAVAANNNDLTANHNLGRELQLNGEMKAAEEQYIRTLEIDQLCSSAWNNLGVIYQDRADYVRARNCLVQATTLSPELPDALNNYANLLEAVGEEEQMRSLYEKAIQLRPGYAEAQHSLSQVQLRREVFKEGWERYAWRCRKNEHDHRPYRHREWDKNPLTNQNLLVFSEQGIGDVVMFATCLPDLMQAVPKFTLEVDGRMEKLFARSFPMLSTIPRPHVDSQPPIYVPDIDCQISLADLPGMYRNRLEEFPRQQALLKADPERVQMWKARYANLGEGLKVGISWFGGKNLDQQTRRSLSLPHWLPILKTEGVHFINLQYGSAANQRFEFAKQHGVPIHDWEDSDPMVDLDDFAAKLSALDLVISIDNATVHFAGGLGVPTWCMLHVLPDWRWFMGRDETPWYESLKLFRQEKVWDWGKVVSQIAEQLKLRVGDHLQQSPVATKPAESPEQKIALGVPAPVSEPVVLQPTQPRCAIITPVGPGHNEIYRQAEESIRTACMQSPGAFSLVTPFKIDDTQGQYGRSRARNFAVQQAAAQGMEWVFFLDADDVVVPNIFQNVMPYLNDYDAIWGQIFSFEDGSQQAAQRPNQLGKTDRFEDILKSDPFYSLQMGHFVRTEVALQHPFDEKMDVGEDFDYYLRVWEKHRCIKIDQPFFANRRGRHSTGPRSGTGRDWTIRVNEMLAKRRAKAATPSAPVAASTPVAEAQSSQPVKTDAGRDLRHDAKWYNTVVRQVDDSWIRTSVT